MKALSPLPSAIWHEVLADLQNERVLWQLAAIVLCVLAGWGIAALARRLLKEGDSRHQGLVERGMRPLSPVLGPLVALGLLALVRTALETSISVSLLRLAIALLGSFALIRVVFYVLRKVFARSGRVGNFLLLFERLFAVVVWLGLAVWLTGMWPAVLGFLEGTLVPLGRHRVSILTIIQGSLSVAVTLVLALWGGALLEERLMGIDTVHSSLRAVMARTGRAILIVVALLLSLSVGGLDLTVLSVFGGALGVGLGLGLQKIVGSYFSGFVILLERSLSLGDTVKIGEFQGQVTRINTRYTVLRSANGTETVVPNDMLMSLAVQNFSLTDKRERQAARLRVSHDTDLERLLPLLLEAIAPLPRVLANPAPQALLTGMGCEGLEVEIGWWLENPENGKAEAQSQVNKALWKVVREQDITIPHPQREVRLIAAGQEPAESTRNLIDKMGALGDQAQKTA